MGWSLAITIRHPIDWSWSSSEGSFHPKIPPSGPLQKLAPVDCDRWLCQSDWAWLFPGAPPTTEALFWISSRHISCNLEGVSNYTEQLFSFPLFHMYLYWELRDLKPQKNLFFVLEDLWEIKAKQINFTTLLKLATKHLSARWRHIINQMYKQKSRKVGHIYYHR